MELDEIKTLLRTRLEEESVAIDTTKLGSATSEKTISVTARIKKNIWLEFAACVLCAAIAVWAVVAYPSLYVYFFSSATWLFAAIFSGYLYALYRKIIFHENNHLPVKENITQIIAIVTRFTFLYSRISLGLLPVIFIFGLITGYIDVAQKGLLLMFHWSAGLLFYTVSFLIWSVIIYFFSKWYIKKLYGNYLSQLKQQLKDIENG